MSEKTANLDTSHVESERETNNEEKDENRLYPCDRCDYKTSDMNNLKMHAESIHIDFDNVYYNCDKCEYKAGDPTLLETHIEAIHVEAIKYWEENVEKIFYACNECDYNTYETNETSLPAHNCDHYTKW